MKLTQRQLDKIAGLINEEAEVRKNLHQEMYNSRKNSVVSEALMFEDHGDLSEFPTQFADDLDYEMTDWSRDLVMTKIQDVIYKSLSSYMKTAGYKMTPGQWMDELEAFDVYEAEMELATDIKTAIVAYAKKVMEAAVMAIGPGEESEAPSATDLEPRYSEYE